MLGLRSLSTLALALVLAAPALAQNLTIETPASLVECEPTALTISGGTAPYYISILPGGEVSATALEILSPVAASGTDTWTVNIAAATSITIQLKDSTGAIAYSSPITVQAGSSTTCLTSSSSASVSSASVAASSASSAASVASSSISTASTASTHSTAIAASSTSSATSAASSAASVSSSATGSVASTSSTAKSGAMALTANSLTAMGLVALVFGITI